MHVPQMDTKECATLRPQYLKESFEMSQNDHVRILHRADILPLEQNRTEKLNQEVFHGSRKFLVFFICLLLLIVIMIVRISAYIHMKKYIKNQGFMG